MRLGKLSQLITTLPFPLAVVRCAPGSEDAKRCANPNEPCKTIGEDDEDGDSDGNGDGNGDGDEDSDGAACQ